MKNRRHTSEQVIRKLAEADKLLAQGKTVEEVACHLEISVNRPGFDGGSLVWFLMPHRAEIFDGSRLRTRPASGRRALSAAAPR